MTLEPRLLPRQVVKNTHLFSSCIFSFSSVYSFVVSCCEVYVYSNNSNSNIIIVWRLSGRQSAVNQSVELLRVDINVQSSKYRVSLVLSVVHRDRLCYL